MASTTARLDDERYPTPPPRVLARLVELPFVAVARTLERLLGRRARVNRAASSSPSPAADREAADSRRT